ncbi:MAG TPA: hypothetical protein VMT85_11195 [Thermoanaerobaculia bacterium]|nr:hypothetical protein [Thermoanaerobaculia bacterium]
MTERSASGFGGLSAPRRTPLGPAASSARPATRTALPWVACLLLSASSGLAQPADTFADRLRVLEIEVPVHVLLGGAPVRGLEAADFRVLDRGEPREIVGFDVIDLSGPDVADPALPDSGAGALPPAQASRSFLTIIDFVNNQGGYLSRSIAALRTMVAEQMQPTDRMALIGLGSRGTAGIVTGFTSDRERLGHALDYLDALADRKGKRQRVAIAALSASAPRSPGEQAQAYGRSAVEAFGRELASVLITAGPAIDAGMADEVGAQLGGGAARSVGSGVEDAFALGASMVNYQRYRDTQLYAEALGNLGALLRGVSGQKHALLLSQGPPFDTFVTETGGAFSPPRDGGAGVATSIETMTEQLSRSGWRIHTLGQGLGFNPSLFYLANETGGTAFENYNRLEVATADLLEQTSVTYLLRILASDVVADGARHQLAVELVEPIPGVEIRHRPHYYAPRSGGELSDVDRRIADAERRLERSARILRAGVLAQPVRESDQWTRILLGVSIGAAEIREISDRGAVDLEIFVTEGSRESADSLLYRVELDGEALGRLPAGGLAFIGDLVVPADAARLDLLVTAEDRRLSRSIAIDGGAGAVQALAPLFFVARGERLLLREARDGAAFEWPLRMGREEVVPWIDPAIERGERLGAMLWLVGELPARLPTPVLLLAGDGGLRADAEGALEVREPQRDGDRAAFLAVLDTTELPPGAYRLEVLWPGLDHAPLLGAFRVVAEER